MRTDPQWVDARRCQVWVRVSLSRADFNRARQRDVMLALGKQVGAMLATAEDASQPVLQRESAAAAAAALLGNSDFAEVPEVPVAGLKLRLGGVNKMLARMKQDEPVCSPGAIDVQAYADSSAAPAGGSPGSAGGLGAAAHTARRRIGWPDDRPSARPQARLASLLSEAGTRALRARRPTNRHHRALRASWRKKRQKEYFAGRTVQLHCSLRLGGKTAPWVKACASLAESLAKLGARTQLDAKPASPAGVTHIRLTAEGRVGTRKDAEDNTPGYRFEGTVNSQVRGLDSPIDDSYQALTGWNPVSAAMATDILAITAAKRLVERIGQSWQ